MSAALAGEEIHVSLSGVTRIYPGNAGTRPVHALGPVDLNLLGLQVHLDNCHNGPVTVDITAQSGPGKLLGNLLGGLAHLLDSNANSLALLNKLNKVAGEIAALV